MSEPESSSSGLSSGLSSGAQAGIGIGVAVVVVGLATAAYVRRRRAIKRGGAPDEEVEFGGMEAGLSEKGARRSGLPVICEGGTCNKVRMVGA